MLFKLKAVSAIAVVLVLAGCKFETRMFANQGLTLDQAVLGVWEEIPKEKSDDKPKRLIVLPYSESEYLLDYAGIYFRAYPLRVGEREFVQVEVLGSQDGPLKSSEKRRFDLWSYRLDDGMLTGMTVNTDLVDRKITARDRLLALFMRNITHPRLFSPAASFRKVVRERSE